MPLDVVAFPACAWLLWWLPGQILLRATGLHGQWSRGPSALLALALSVAVTPVLLNPLWHLSHDGNTLAISIGAILLVLQELSLVRGVADRQPRRLLTAPLESLVLSALLLFVAGACLLTYWPQLGVPAQIHDYIKHHAVLFSLERSPLPLGNPFFAPRADGPVYYYHFFYLIPATLRAVAPSFSIPFVFGLQAAAVAVSSIGLCALLARVLYGGSPPALLAAILASVVGGFDLLPVVAKGMRAITLDAWADTSVRIHNLLTQFVWTPQNMQGVLLLLLACFLLNTCRRPAVLTLLLGLLTASLIGSTVWVAAAVLPAALALALLHAIGGRGQAIWISLGLGSGTALLLSLPSLIGYARTSATLGKGLTLTWTHQQDALLGQFLPPGILANIVDLPWILVLEFGPLLVLPLLVPRSVWSTLLLSPGGRLLLGSAATALLAFVTVRSHFTYNDFGQKVILAAQAAGVIVGAGLLHGRLGHPFWWNPLGWMLRPNARFGPRAGIILAIVCLLGLPVGLLQTPLATVRRMLPASGPLARLVPESALQARQEADLLQAVRTLPADAVVQADWGAARVELLQLINRQIGVTELERDTMVFQAGPGEARNEAVTQLGAVLETEADAEVLHATLRHYGISHVMVGAPERERWIGLARLDAPTWFRSLYDGPDGMLVEVRETGEAAPAGQ